MALVLNTLLSGLQAICDPTSPAFVGYPMTPAAAQTAWGNAYDRYANAGVDMAGNALSPSSGPSRFGNPLGFASVNSASTSAGFFDAAFVAYWTGRTFGTGVLALPGLGVGGTGVFSLVTTSIATPPVPGLLAPTLVPLFTAGSRRAPTTTSQLTALALAIHTVTANIVVVMTGVDTTPPPAGPLPVVATGVVS